MNDLDKINAYQKAAKRVKGEKAFYTHVGVYLFINIIIFIAMISLRHYFYSDYYFVLNLISTPLIWGVFLLIHGVLAFRGGKKVKKISDHLNPLKKWEEQKIKELMEKDDSIKDTSYE